MDSARIPSASSGCGSRKACGQPGTHPSAAPEERSPARPVARMNGLRTGLRSLRRPLILEEVIMPLPKAPSRPADILEDYGPQAVPEAKRSPAKAKRAKAAAIPSQTADDLHMDGSETGLSGSATQVVRVTYPKVTRQGRRINSAEGLESAIGEMMKVLEDKNCLEAAR